MVESIRAEMSANIYKIEVAVGDAVREGDPVMILESMKMEIPVVTEEGGTVTALHVAEGDVVQSGQVLVALE